MAKYDRMTVLNSIVDVGVVPVFYHKDPQTTIDVIKACAEGGARCVEFTNRGDLAWKVFVEATEHILDNDLDIILGVGSIVDAPTAGIYISSGANFVVGPLLNPEVAKVCNRRKVPYSPGCGSASEIAQAEELGVEICKVFPGGEVGGPGFVKSVLGPCPWTRIMPTGGVSATRESLEAWFTAGVACVGIGSNLVTKDVVANKDYASLTKHVRQTVTWIEEIRGELAK
ncbi:MAG: bifunctional 4-hydroxy-2-oxoglutarate aldolase/2-dehydro-3-deoxy-phosphogluconate aldolase [Gemmatimonadetes bacterium]|jgi:2-dehydro-3-deoxyphosphogluconate aldolase / (4S)-4-hydroxy-2-oxoglutarate aldolase|nr:bifunctional 4-hydroxy-2-oxoglutarate aldolase/2-dehydro-3-deoxy-phosphogluconate aldolase [Gemmatimonadota bacterium]MBT6144451.1 bifunctional 4-hydroxy-2-oxoglutarate aldolase/2-dehydro-3-deoxy-phosphogluconate aldolase [Gemmatimonadota bacterium]MBT7863967.1 bifunctional 4-hydroxy-2-oxoglutarate aldolase/2-dehydro-3-deoxy-phosphogluconate aldolase [Gemmatimonadota bacterium]